MLFQGLLCMMSSLIKVLGVSLSITSSFWSFIVSCCFLILLLPNIASSEGLFRYATSISRCQASSRQFPYHKHFLHCSSSLSSPPDCSYCFMLLLNPITSKYSFFRGLWLIYWSSFWKVLSVLLSFFSISNNNIHYLFPEICDSSVNFWSEAPFSVLW